MQAPDRILILEPVDGKPLDTRGIVDPRLFKDGEGGNKLHAVMDSETTLWTFKYEKGTVPPALKGSFTGFRALKKHADEYFKQRNIKISEVR
jgi:hypothetical protein